MDRVSTVVLPPDPDGIRTLGQALRRGDLAGLPTETVYGLAAWFEDAAACRAIFTLKGRPLLDPLILHAGDLAAVETVAVLSDAALRVAAAFWPGPLTLVLPRREVVPDLVTAGLPTVAVRVPGKAITRTLLQEHGLILAAPSANPFGRVSPTTAQHVLDYFGGRLRWILDGGPCEVGLESTILDLSEPSRPTILRPGAITARQLAAVLGCTVETSTVKAGAGQALRAPGTLARHYSPRTPLVLFPSGQPPIATPAVGVARVRFQRPAEPLPGELWLTEDGSPAVAAASLYRLLLHLDAQSLAGIEWELAPAVDFGLAINDRLRRAAAR